MLVALLTVSAALAATITVAQDDKYADADKDYHRTLKYVKVFNVQFSSGSTGHTATNTQDDPLTITDSVSTGVSYYLDSPADDAWINALSGSGTQNYFTLTPNATNTRYYVTANSGIDAKAAAQWLYAHKPATVNWTTMTYTAGSGTTAATWTADIGTPAYVLIASFDTEDASGTEALATNLVAATSDISIIEKNSYPTVDKKQRDGTSGSYTNDPVKVKVGDLIDYEVTVTVPADASLPIHVTDTMSSGLPNQYISAVIGIKLPICIIWRISMKWFESTAEVLQEGLIYKHSELIDLLRRDYPYVSDNSYHWAIQEMIKSGRIVHAGHDQYKVADGTQKPIYEPRYSSLTNKIIQKVSDQFPNVKFVVLEMAQYNEFFRSPVPLNLIIIQVTAHILDTLPRSQQELYIDINGGKQSQAEYTAPPVHQNRPN